MKLAGVLLLLLPMLPAQDDELVLRWNQFAHDANEYLHTIDVKPETRAAHKARLKREWDAVYPLL